MTSDSLPTAEESRMLYSTEQLLMGVSALLERSDWTPAEMLSSVSQIKDNGAQMALSVLSGRKPGWLRVADAWARASMKCQTYDFRFDIERLERGELTLATVNRRSHAKEVRALIRATETAMRRHHKRLKQHQDETAAVA